MSDTAITVENLSKSYLVGHNAAQTERYTALRDVLARNVKSLARKTRDMIHGRPIIQGDEVEEFWALKDVSFEVRRGETLGIIGRNGAGKSTLLKILSRITEPTKGRITLNGRVASLLEVGTGFHPELSGRENIFLNGAILGMTRSEVQRKFDEIVGFAEVENFLDTPVKRYSSGMYVRLAFAVAAHLEPEILVVDEVLAVGDVQFQKKCLGKMKDVGREGRTVLFVSHNLTAIRSLCETTILLTQGALSLFDKTNTVIKNYMDFASSAENFDKRTWPIESCPGNEKIKLLGVFFKNDDFGPEHKSSVELNIFSHEQIDGIDFSLNIVDQEGNRVIHTATCAQINNRRLTRGFYSINYSFPCNLLRQGIYTASVASTIPNQYYIFEQRDALTFRVPEREMDGSIYPSEAWQGSVDPTFGWWAIESR